MNGRLEDIIGLPFCAGSRAIARQLRESQPTIPKTTIEHNAIYQIVRHSDPHLKQLRMKERDLKSIAKRIAVSRLQPFTADPFYLRVVPSLVNLALQYAFCASHFYSLSPEQPTGILVA
jgi:hypothetical protein